jgi:hypothetical protein
MSWDAKDADEKFKDLSARGIISNFNELAESAAHAILSPLKGNTFSRFLSFSSLGNQTTINFCKIYSSLSQNMANEFFAQMNRVNT